MPRVVLFGVSHSLQPVNVAFADSVEELRTTMKDHFRKTLEAIVADFKVDLIAEECKENEDTFARRIAEQRGIQYLEIDIAKTQREKFGLPKNTDGLSEEETKKFHRTREEYWLARISEVSKAKSSLLIVIGNDHMSSLSCMLKKSFGEQELIRYNEQFWFKEFVQAAVDQTGMGPEFFTE